MSCMPMLAVPLGVCCSWWQPGRRCDLRVLSCAGCLELHKLLLLGAEANHAFLTAKQAQAASTPQLHRRS